MKKLTYMSLFSGLGGFEIAIQSVIPDTECVGYSEIDEYPLAVYKKHFPNHKNFGDITKIDIESIPDFDLLVGGPNCQDLSVAKKNREGLAGSRSKLFFNYLEILKVKKPKFFIMENVASMPKDAKETISRLLGVEPVLLDAAKVSAQSRKRLFWIGKWDGNNYEKVNIPQPEDKKIFLKDILEPQVDEKYFITNPKVLEKVRIKEGNSNKIGIIGTKDSQANRIYDTKGKSVTLSSLSGGSGAKTGLYAIKNLKSGEDKSACLSASCYKGYGNEGVTMVKDIVGCAARTFPRTKVEGVERTKQIEERKDGKANCLTSVQNDSLVKSNTLTEAIGRAGSSREFISSINKVNSSGFGIRRLTVIECERLQSLPDRYTICPHPKFKNREMSESRRYKMLGNAVNVEVIKHILRCIDWN